MKLSQQAVYILSALALLLASVFTVGFHHADEHFQLLEFANYKLGNTELSNLTWEYSSKLRPTLQPTITVGVIKFLNAFGVQDPFYIAFFLRLLSSVLALFTMYLLHKVYRDKFQSPTIKYWFLLTSFLLWITIYVGARFSSENWSAMFFVIGFSSYFLSFKSSSFKKYLLAGVLMGFSFQFRYQAGFMIVGFAAWLLFIEKEKLKYLITFSLVILSIIGAGVLVDIWFYGEFTFSAYNYFYENIMLNKAQDYGVDPWWSYITAFIERAIPPFSILFLGAFGILFYFKWKNPLTWVLVPFILIHFVLSHKELRFLFPMVYFLPIIFFTAIQTIQEKWKPLFIENRWVKITVKATMLVYGLVLLIVSFKPGEVNVRLYDMVYHRYQEPVRLTIATHLYKENEPIHYFYLRDNLTYNKVKDAESFELNNEEINLLVLDNQELPEDYKYSHKLVYSSFPNWMKSFNFGGWMERATYRRVYEITISK